MSPKEYGVFKWDGMNMYRRKDALKIYKQSAAAGKYAEKLQTEKPIERGYVVRSVDPAPRPEDDLETPISAQWESPPPPLEPITPPFNLPSPEIAAQELSYINKQIEIQNWIKDWVSADDERYLRDLYEDSQLKLEIDDTKKDEAKEELEKEIREELEQENLDKVEAAVEAKKSEIRKEIENDVSFDIGQALTDIKKDLEEAIKQYGSAYKPGER